MVSNSTASTCRLIGVFGRGQYYSSYPLMVPFCGDIYPMLSLVYPKRDVSFLYSCVFISSGLPGVFLEGRRTEVIFDMNKLVRFGRETLAVRQRRVAAVGEDEGEENCSLHA